MARLLLVLSLVTIFTCPGITQDIPVGTWRNHFSFSSIQRVASEGDRTFASSELALFLFDDEEITRLSKINGLNGGAITGMAYASSGDVLLVGYEDGGIDLIQEGALTNLSDLTDGNFGELRSINGFIIQNSFAYAATDFGVATINLTTQEITEIFREIGPNGDILQIEEILFSSGSLYAASSRGILIGDLSLNLLDFNNWHLSSDTEDFQNLAVFENEVVASRNGIIFQLNGISGVWDTLVNVSFAIRDLLATNDQLYILGATSLQALQNGQLTSITPPSLASGIELSVDQNELWIADEESGLIRVQGGNEQLILPNGPASDNITHIEFTDSLFAFYANLPGNVPLDSTGYSVFSEGLWDNREIEGFYNISDVTSFEGNTFLSSNSDGIYDLNNQEKVTGVFGEGPIIVPAIFGTSEGLFAIRYGHSNALYLFREDTWESWSAASVGSSNLVDMTASLGNVLWLTIEGAGGIIAIDPIGEQSRLINQSDGLASSRIESVTIDLEDQAWIGTQAGTSFFVDATFVFDEFEAFTPFFENRVLFDEEAVTAIAIDGGNRKWMATKDGIWVFDQNVAELEVRFNTENSPLPSNNVLEFAYDHESGEMFILTDRGLVSYRTGSSAGNIRHNNVQIFPNPVRPQDTGPVTIRGLAQDANIKITDVQGNLIRELESLGGTATWDLRNSSGSTASSGIYLLFSSTGNREETFIGKFAVIR